MTTINKISFKFFCARLAVLSGTLLSLAQGAHSATESSSAKDFEALSLEDLLNVKVEGASFKKATVIGTPSAVTIVTSEEIRRSGARTLVDVLSMVPGLNFAADVQGILGIVVRGMWAHEGKALLLIDGEEMNELSYSTTQFGNHYPIDAISKVEVIRGPGSAVHGGFGELVVINVITKTGEELHGAELSFRYGQNGGSFVERTLNASIGGVKSGWILSSHVYGGQSNQSAGAYTDATGSSFDFSDNARQNPLFIDLGAAKEDLKFRLIYDRYNTTDRTAYGTNAQAPMDYYFSNLAFGASYKARLSDTLSLVPEFHFTRQTPWNLTDPAAKQIPQLYYDVTDEQSKLKLTLHDQISSDLTATAGVETAVISSYDSTPGGSYGTLYSNGKQSIDYYQNSAFAEVDWETGLANFTLGGRYQSQNAGGASVVPRIAATRDFGSFYAKAMHSWGYRPPGIENLRINPNLTSETTKVSELEVGYRFTSNWVTSLNVFANSLESPIIFGYSSGSQTYTNAPSASCEGLEWDMKWGSETYKFDVNYSLTRPKDIPADYRVPGQAEYTLGIPNQKGVVSINTQVFDRATNLNLSAIYFSNTYGYSYDAASASGLSVQEFPSAVMTNLFLQRTDVAIKGLSVGVGAFNLFDQKSQHLQPYNGGHPPIPARARDWVAQVSYKAEM